MTSNFPPTSRYYGLPTATLVGPRGEPLVYLRRRFVPGRERFALLHEYVVGDGDRLDLVAASELGDPEAFWRVADANAAMRPETLTATPGRRLRITLPEGIPGARDA